MAVVGGNGLVLLLAAAVLIPPQETAEPTVAPVPAAAPEAARAPRPVSAPVEAPIPLPGVARASIVRASAPVRVAARAQRKAAEGCDAGTSKAVSRSIKVARSATPESRPDGA